MKKFLCLMMSLIFVFSFASCLNDKNTPSDETDKESYFCTFDSDKIKVITLGAYDGLFVEKGGFDNVTSVAAIKIRNDSGRMIEYAKLSFRVNEYERAEFEIKAVPAGAQALVMEITARQYSADDKYTLINDGESSFAAYCDASMNDDKIQITTDGGNITVKNISDSPISEMSIYYKYLIDGIYYGGIAFSGKFQDIKPGESVTQTSERFSKNGVIVNTRIA